MPSLRRQEACHSDEGGVGRGRGEARKKPISRLADERQVCELGSVQVCG